MEGAGAEPKLRAAAIAITPAEIDAASEGFHRIAPRRSAKRVLHWTQACLIAALLFGAFSFARRDPALAWLVLCWSAAALFAITIFWRLIAAASLQPALSRIAEDQGRFWPVYTILCPLYREGVVVAELIAALDRIDYPADALDIKLLIEGDDADTLAVALAAAANRPHIEILVLPPATPRTKPKALNAGLARARGDYVAVYDAEDRPHPLQMRAALAAFEDQPELGCAQAPLVIDNAAACWIARQFAAEYAIQFRELLPLLARLNLPLPLGGSSNHFRRRALDAVHGWDPYNVREKVRAFAA